MTHNEKNKVIGAEVFIQPFIFAYSNAGAGTGRQDIPFTIVDEVNGKEVKFEITNPPTLLHERWHLYGIKNDDPAWLTYRRHVALSSGWIIYNYGYEGGLMSGLEDAASKLQTEMENTIATHGNSELLGESLEFKICDSPPLSISSFGISRATEACHAISLSYKSTGQADDMNRKFRSSNSCSVNSADFLFIG